MQNEVSRAEMSVFAPAYAERRIGHVNWLGIWTLYKKEVMRFFKVGWQTIAAPAITTLLFFTIFTIALGGTRRGFGDVSFAAFLAPGLIMMSVLQNAFANTSSSLLISKVQGNIVDVLMPPLSAGELTFCFTMGGLTRGVVVAVSVAVPLSFFADMPFSHIGFALYFLFAASLMLSLIGIAGGIWSDKFDHLAAVTNFVIMPLSFLSGTFYSVDALPEAWSAVSHYNPFFYMIDGFRYGVLGVSDSNPWIGVAVTMAINVLLWLLCYRLFRSGWRLKS